MKIPVSSLWDEFKTFAFKGNMIDLAVAVVIGGAFGDIIKAMVADIIMPLVGYTLAIFHVPQSYQSWTLGRFTVGHLLAEIINFAIIAAVVFIVIVKLLGVVMKKATGPGETPPADPVVKECPYCLSTIPIKARKCAFCTSELPMTA